jgi:hypothetical protein
MDAVKQRGSLTLLARALGVVAVGLLGLCVVLARFTYPSDASCYTPEGYDTIKAHAELITSVALLALFAAGSGGALCLVGAATAAGRRLRFALGSLLFAPMFLASLFIAFAAGFYCQN